MTVQELIDKLQKIEAKDLPVYWTTMTSYQEVTAATIHEGVDYEFVVID